MAEAAEAAVSYVLGKLADALLNNAQEQMDVSGQIEQMQKELRLIQALLRDADSKRNINELATEWLNQVREIADKINTVIDTFRVKIEENCPESSNLFTKFKRNYETYKHGLRKELEDITQKLTWIYQRGTDLAIKDNLGGLDNVDDPDPSDKVDDPEVVGLEDDKGKIIEQLLDRSISRRTVLSIVGTGGLGKTTLAQKVYKSANLEGQFDCRAWLSISQKYNKNGLWREILYLVEPQMKNKTPPITDEDLLVKLKSSLRCKRYLIILDDVWDIDLWEQLKIALPDLNNASRVIITTRSLDVAKAADCNTKPYKLRYLSDAEGLALLFRNAFQQDVQPENYPHLLEVATRLMKKCGGLPLALVVLGGILRRRDRTYTAWSKMEETMDWHNEDGEKCLKILARSYEDLPDHLKPCFLYFASFPEDYKISGKHVTRMWLAEGFISKDGAGTMEDRAEAYLEELIQRYLILVTEKSWNGNCKYCSMHDLLRDLAIHEAKKKNFFTVFSDSEDVNQLAARKPCRVALQFCTPTKDVNLENTRSLLYFGFGPKSSKDSCFGLLNFSGFRLLSVLTIEHVDLRNFSRGQWLKGLIHLRYLGFRYCFIRQEIFKNISFNNLETIDLKGSQIAAIDWFNVIIQPLRLILGPQIGEKIIDLILGLNIWGLQIAGKTLRHIYGPLSYGILFTLKWDHLTNLQTLKSVGQEEVPRLGCSTKNLRTLGIYYDKRTDRDEEWETLKGVLRRTKKLVSLSIETRTSPPGKILLPFGIGGTRGLPCHDTMQDLHLNGKWTDLAHSRLILLPSVEMFPTNLTKLTLEYSKLQEDPMRILGRLQSLMILRLWYKSYEGTNMICSTGGFPNLEKMELIQLYKLTHWDINEGAMPILSHLEIEGCSKLHALPELQKVRSLQELIVVLPSNELRRRMQGEDLYKTEHISYVRII